MRSVPLSSEPSDVPPLARPPRPRIAVCPPDRSGGHPWLARLRGWLGSAWQRDASTIAPGATRPAPALDAVRQEFIDAVEDLRAPAAEALLDRIHYARSLRELWHLRAEVFRLVSLHHSQAEADARVNALSRHFPTRSPRSGFAPLHAPAGNRTMWP
jgi:hypothetical protein